MKLTTEKNTKKVSSGNRAEMELNENELDFVAGGKMSPSLYTAMYNKIQKSGIAVALKEKAFKELDAMRASGTTYSPKDVENMLRKRGIE